MGARVRLLFVLGLALVVAPAVAVATRPSVSPVYQANYKGFESGSSSKLAVKFGMTIAENEIVPRGHWFAYGMHDIRLYTDCSQSPVRVPGAINTSASGSRCTRRPRSLESMFSMPRSYSTDW